MSTRERGVDIEWRTSTPDGRVLTVRRADRGWSAACEGAEAAGDELVTAIREAVGHDRGESLSVGVTSTAAIDRWIRDTDAHIVGDTLH